MAALNGAQNGGISVRGDKGDRLLDDQKTKDVRSSNILAAKVSGVVEVLGELLKKKLWVW